MEKAQRKDLVLEMLQKEPEDLFLNYALAMEYMALEDFKQANIQLLHTLKLNPEYLPCFYQLGQLNEKLEDNDSAISFYKRGLELAKKQGNTKAMGELNEALWMLED